MWMLEKREIYLHISEKSCNFACLIEKYAMPVTKQKLIRHYALDRCLRNQTRRYYIEDLLAECNKALEANSSAKSAVETAELQTIDNKVDIHHNFSNNYLHV